VTRNTSNRPEDDATPSGTGGFLGQVGLFEAANGLPHGPVAIALAIAAAIVIYPVTRLARMFSRR
jgi:hypothetical protein